MSKTEKRLDKWLKEDPFLTDVEGALRSLETEIIPVKVTVHLSHTEGYEIWLEIPLRVVQPEDPEPDEEYYRLKETFLHELKRIRLKKGATSVYREEDGKWYWYGDLEHCSKEDIMENVETLWKLWNTVGKQIKGAFGVTKDYDHSVYIATLTSTDQGLPGISIMHYDMPCFRRNHGPTHPLDLGLDLSDDWTVLERLTESLLLHELLKGNPDEDIWTLHTDLPAMAIWRKTAPEVEEYLEQRTEKWDPFNDIDVQRNGGVEIIHPFLRRVLRFTWETAEWHPGAERARELYYRQFTYEELTQLHADELKAICVAKGLSSQGRKDELIEAIHKACWKVDG